MLKSGCQWGKPATMIVTFPISALDQTYYPEASLLLGPGARKYALPGDKKSLSESLWVALDADAVKGRLRVDFLASDGTIIRVCRILGNDGQHCISGCPDHCRLCRVVPYCASGKRPGIEVS